MGFVSLFLILILVVLPVIGGIMLIVLGRRRGKGFPACGQCGYDVSATLGTANARCPECGSDFGVVGITPAKTKSNKGAILAGIALIALPLLCFGATIIPAYTLTSRARTAAQSARAAAVQQQALAQQAQFATMTPDPALIESYRERVASMTEDDASARLAAIKQELAQRQADQTLNADNAAQLRAEQQALAERLGDTTLVAPQQP